MSNSKGNLGSTLSKKFKSGRRSRGEPNEQSLMVQQTSAAAFVAPECSVTQQGDLAEFLSRAELLGASFDSAGGPGGSLRLLTPGEAAATGRGAGVLAKAERERRRLAAEGLRGQLRIPRRPAWSRESTTPAELEAAEREAFLQWREAMAVQEARDGVAMTPFEKNLDFWRQLWRVLERSRAVVQIVDARDPLFFYSQDLDAYARELGCRTALLLNKCDLLAPQQLAEWRRYFAAAGMRAMFFSAKPEDAESARELDVLSPEGLADALASLAAEASSSADCPVPESSSSRQRQPPAASPVVGLVGYPNVGKSSTINSLLRAKKVPESATPGRTKHLQTLPLGDRLILCDCPGLVMPQFVGTSSDLVVHGVLPIDNMRDCLGPVQLLCDRLGRRALADVYGLGLPPPPEPLTSQALLTAYALQHGYVTGGHGLPHLDRAAREILKDFVNGRDRRRLVYCHAPPDFAQGAAAFNSHLPIDEEVEAGEGGEATAAAAAPVLTEFDRDFFGLKTADVRFRAKGRPLSAAAALLGNAASADGKPWKRHNNGRKREKLRRTCRHLDQ